MSSYLYNFDDSRGPTCIAANQKYVAVGDMGGSVRFYELNGDQNGKVGIQ